MLLKHELQVFKDLYKSEHPVIERALVYNGLSFGSMQNCVEEINSQLQQLGALHYIHVREHVVIDRDKEPGQSDHTITNYTLVRNSIPENDSDVGYVSKESTRIRSKKRKIGETIVLLSDVDQQVTLTVSEPNQAAYYIEEPSLKLTTFQAELLKLLIFPAVNDQFNLWATVNFNPLRDPHEKATVIPFERLMKEVTEVNHWLKMNCQLTDILIKIEDTQETDDVARQKNAVPSLLVNGEVIDYGARAKAQQLRVLQNLLK